MRFNIILLTSPISSNWSSLVTTSNKILVQICLLFHTNCTTHPAHHNLLHFFKIYCKEMCTACSRTRYKTVPLINLNKYLHNSTGETEVDINLNVNNDGENILKQKHSDFLLHLTFSHRATSI